MTMQTFKRISISETIYNRLIAIKTQTKFSINSIISILLDKVDISVSVTEHDNGADADKAAAVEDKK